MSQSLKLKQCVKALAVSRQRFLSYRNQSIDSLCKSIDWFLYDRDLRHERVKEKSEILSAFMEKDFERIRVISNIFFAIKFPEMWVPEKLIYRDTWYLETQRQI